MQVLRGLMVSIALLASGLLWGPAHAQGIGGAVERVTWTAEAPPRVHPGETLQVALTGQIADGWKMYAVDSPKPSRGVTVRFDSIPDGFAEQTYVAQRPPQEGYDPNFDKTVRYFEGQAVVATDFAVDPGVAAGTYELGGTVEFMICTDEMCLPPTRTPFAVSVAVSSTPDEAAAEVVRVTTAATDTVATGEDTPANTPADAGEAPSTSEGAAGESASSESNAGAEGGATVASARGDLDRARSGGLWGFLLLAVGAGAAALLTPCVFPMIPLTVSYFTKHADSRSEAFRMAGVYGLSIVVIFTALGVLMAALVGAAGAQSIAANPWVNLFIGAVFIFFALSLLGLFELRLPSSIVNFANQQGNERAGYTGVLFMGLTLTLVSFSCTAPFVGGLLAATTGGEWTYPVVGMLAFSATFALPFVGFALFPNGLDALPTSGSWMNVVKVVLGFVELAAALKFLSNADLVWGMNLLSRPLAIALTVVIFALCGLYLLGKLQLKHAGPTGSIGSLRLITSMAFLGLALYMVPGLFGASLGTLDAYLPPRQVSDPSFMAASTSGGSATTSNGELDWYVDDREAAFAAAKAQDKPVFIDFTGYTCTNCRDMEANVFTRPAVAQRFEEQFVLLRLYTDAPPKGPEYQRYQLRLTGTTALPTYVVLDPQNESVISRESGTMSTEAFVAFLERGASSFSEQQLAMR